MRSILPSTAHGWTAGASFDVHPSAAEPAYSSVSSTVPTSPTVPTVLCHTRNLNLPDVVDAVAVHREPFEAVAHAGRGVPGRICADVRDDAVGEDAPGENLEPAAVFFNRE